MIDLHIPGDKWWNDRMDKFERSEMSLKYRIDFQLTVAKIPHHREQSIYSQNNGCNKWSLLADLASWPHKGWLIECKRKADMSSCSKALGQCLMYRAMAGYKHPIICFPEKEYHESACLHDFKRVCETNKIEVAHEESILKIIQHYESIYTTDADTALRVKHYGSTYQPVTKL